MYSALIHQYSPSAGLGIGDCTIHIILYRNTESKDTEDTIPKTRSMRFVPIDPEVGFWRRHGVLTSLAGMGVIGSDLIVSVTPLVIWSVTTIFHYSAWTE